MNKMFYALQYNIYKRIHITNPNIQYTISLKQFMTFFHEPNQKYCYTIIQCFFWPNKEYNNIFKISSNIVWFIFSIRAPQFQFKNYELISERKNYVFDHKRSICNDFDLILIMYKQKVLLIGNVKFYLIFPLIKRQKFFDWG